MNPFRLTRTRNFQVAFLGLLLVCVGQLAWWVWDEIRFADRTRHVQFATHENDRLAATDLLARGAPPEQVRRWFPELVVEGRQVEVDPEVRRKLDARVAGRTNRFLWEGGFFLVILVSGALVLTRAVAQQDELRRQKDNFLSAVSHELKSPLASIRLGADTLGLRDGNPDTRRKWVGRILDEVTRLETMINNLLYASHMGDGDLLHAPEEFALLPVLHQVLDELKPRLTARGTRVDLDVPDDLVVRADPAGLRSVLRNLLDNAVKATARCREPRLQVETATVSGMVRLAVTDNGSGFEPGQAAELFRRFHRLGDEMRRDTTGSGLGLYLVRRFVERDGGAVSASSPGPGRGATFTVSWPLAKESRR